MIDLFPNETFFVQWVIFLIAFFVLRSLVFRPTLRLFEERKRQTEGERVRAEQLVEKTARLIEQVETKLGQARDKGLQQKETLLKEGYDYRNKISQDVRDESQKMMKEVQARIAKEGNVTRAKLREEAQKIGQIIAEKILERPL